MSEVQETRQATKPRPSAGLMYSFSLFVLLPSLVGAIYFGLIASDRYVAEARYAIRTGSQAPMGGFIESIVTSSLGGNTRQDAEIVRSFVLSLEMLEQLGRRFDLRAHYESSEIDWLSRLDPAASQEDFLEYLEDRIEVTIDPESSISTLRVHAFSPEAALVIADQILDLSEQLVNTMSERISEDMLRFARNELDRTEAQVLEATTAMTRFRKETRSIDPGEETSAVLGIITELETSLANTQTELIEVRSVMRSGSPKIRNLETRVAALKHQVLKERDRLANTHDTDLTSLIDQYQPLLLEQELAKQRYASALNSLEIARADAQRQQSYLLAFVAPQRPTEATQPKRVWMIATVFACAVLIYGIGGLIWSAIKDHMRL